MGNVSRNIYNVETTRSFEKKKFLTKKNYTRTKKKVMNLMNDKLIDNFNFYQPINSKIITLLIINSSPIVNHNTSTKSSCSFHIFTKVQITNSEFSQICLFYQSGCFVKMKKIRATIILLVVELFVKNSVFGVWKFVKTCNEQLKCYEEKNVLL